MSNEITLYPSTQALISLGLGQNEAILYEILLKNPSATIPLLQSKSQFSRTMLYHILKNLAAYELVTESKKDTKTEYNAVAPEKLEDMIKEQEKELARQKEKLHSVIGDLSSTYRLATNKPGIKFFEGAEGNKEVLYDSLKSTGTIYTFADTEAIEKYGKNANAHYVKARLAQKIPKKIIAIDSPFTRSHYSHVNSELTEVRFIKKDTHPFQLGTQIYNNTVSFTTLNEKKMIGIIIEDENIAQFHRSLFEYIWNSLPIFTPPVSTPARPHPSNGPILALNES